MSEETAWVIEHGGHPAPLYWTGRSWGEWSGDHMKACRFSRRYDAQKVALAVGDPSARANAHKVAEHVWYEAIMHTDFARPPHANGLKTQDETGAPLGMGEGDGESGQEHAAATAIPTLPAPSDDYRRAVEHAANVAEQSAALCDEDTPGGWCAANQARSIATAIRALTKGPTK